MDFSLVTMIIPQLKWQEDMELPARIRISELITKILFTLKQYDAPTFGSISDLYMYFEGKALNRDLSLADYQIWDGNTIEIRF